MGSPTRQRPASRVDEERIVGRALALLLLIAVVALVAAVPAWADGPTGSDPASNFPLGPMPEACVSQPDGATCQNAAIYYLDEARASLEQPAYALPPDFTSLSPIDRELILTNLDRALYGLPAITGLTAALNAAAATGVPVDQDPLSSDPHFSDYTSNWAAGFPNIEGAHVVLDVRRRDWWRERRLAPP